MRSTILGSAVMTWLVLASAACSDSDAANSSTCRVAMSSQPRGT